MNGNYASKFPATVLASMLIGAVLLLPSPAFAQSPDPSIATCLKAWGKHPFGRNPEYKTLATSVKVFGIGRATADTDVTSAPTLVLVSAGVNVMGGSTVELLNPNGWYCLRSNVNVMGGLTIKAHCKSHLASAIDGVTVMGDNAENKGVTVMGATRVEHVGCQ